MLQLGAGFTHINKQSHVMLSKRRVLQRWLCVAAFVTGNLVLLLSVHRQVSKKRLANPVPSGGHLPRPDETGARQTPCVNVRRCIAPVDDRVAAVVSETYYSAARPTKCEELPCRQSLQPLERKRYEWCTRVSAERLKLKASAFVSFASIQRQRCRLLADPLRTPVFLASAPGSGNTWLRELLESVTGLCTGSVYCDEELRVRGFEAEGLRSGQVVVVKTHETTPFWSQGTPHETRKNVTLFGSGILLVRNPFNSLASHYKWVRLTEFGGNRSTHVENVEIEQGLEWMEFIYDKMKDWSSMFRYVVTSSPERPVLVLSYEDLQRNTSAQLQRVVDFLRLNVTVPAELEPGSVTTFLRRPGGAAPYTSWQVDSVRKYLRSTIQLLAKYPEVKRIVMKYYSEVPRPGL